MELVPQDTQEPEDFSYLSERAQFARNKNKVVRLDPSKRQAAKEILENTFEIIGGVPRFALHADENPDEFYKTYFKYTLGMHQSHDHTIRLLAPALPPSPLDGDVTDVEFEEVKND